MSVTVKEFNGHDIATAPYEAKLRLRNRPEDRAAEILSVTPLTGFPRLARAAMSGQLVILEVDLLTISAANIQTLQQWFRVGTVGPLLVDFEGANRIKDCVVQAARAFHGSPAVFMVELFAHDPRWRSELETADTQAITASPTDFTLTNPGNAIEDKPRFYLRPYTLKADTVAMRYKKPVSFAWRSPTGWENYPVDLTDGGWPHNTEVSANRSLASGDDVRVIDFGVEVPRWDGGGATSAWNKALTTVWANLTFSGMQKADLRANVTATAPANGEDLEVDPGGTVGWPESGVILIGSEEIAYHGKTARNVDGHAAFRNVIRGRRGTTAASHTAGDDLFWLEHSDLEIMYGHQNAAAPPDWSAFKPMINLDTSTNTSLVWNEFSDDDNPGRSLPWKRVLRTDDSQNDRILAPGGSPDAVLNFEYQKGGAVAGKPNGNAWTIKLPIGTAQSGNAFSFTRAIDDTVGLVYLATDADGSEIELDREGGAIVSATKDIAAASFSYKSFTIYCRSQVIASNPTPVGSEIADAILVAATWTAAHYQQFTAPSKGAISKVMALIAETNATQAVANASLWSDDGADDRQTQFTDNADATILASTEAWYTWTFAAPVEVPRSMLMWLGLREETATAASQRWQGFSSPGSKVLFPDPTLNETRSFEYKIISMDMDFADGAAAEDGETAVVDDCTIALLAADAPLVVLGARQDAYLAKFKLRNLTTGLQEIAFSRLLKVLDVVEIDVAEGVIRNLSAGPLQVQTSGAVTFDTEGSAPAGGAKVEDTDGRVQIPARYLDVTQGAMIFRLQMGWNGGAATLNPGIVFYLAADANNFIQLRWDDTLERWELERRTTAGTAEVTVSDTLVLNQKVTVIAKWDEDFVSLSIDGGAFVNVANTRFPAITATLMDLGSDGSASSQIDSTILWSAGFRGALTNADAADIDAFGDTDPELSQFPAAAEVQFVWWANDKTYFAVGFPRGPSIEGRHDRGEVFSDLNDWLTLDPGANVLQLEEAGLAGVAVDSRISGRWE